MRKMRLNTIFLSALLILLPLSGCLDEEMKPRTEVSEDGSEQCWAILQTITSMEHDMQMMRDNHYTMTNFTYDSSCNLVYSSWWGGDGYGGFTNITYNDDGQPILIETGDSDWNNTTGSLEGYLYLSYEEYTYENGLLMQLHTYYAEGGDEYWNYTYDSEGREISEEYTGDIKESYYNSEGKLSYTKKQTTNNYTTYNNYTYDGDGQLIQEAETSKYGSGDWYGPYYTNYTYVDGLLVSTDYGGNIWSYTHNEKGDVLTEVNHWGENYSSIISHTWGFANTV